MSRFALILALALVVALPVAVIGAEPTTLEAAPISPGETCTPTVAGGSVAPAKVPAGLPGYHAAWYGQSGFPTLCPGGTATLTVAYYNSGSLGWYPRGSAAPLLGTWNPDPGQDRPSFLGGDGSGGSPSTGWPSADRPAAVKSDYVGPGQVAWFEFTVKAPPVAGVYRLAVRPLIEGVRWLEDYGVYWYIAVKTDDSSVPPLPPPPVPAVTALPPPPRTYYPSVVGGYRAIRVPSLMFHYVSWLPPAADALRRDLTVSPVDFEGMLKLLREQGYTTITSPELWWTLDQGGPLPAKPVQLTFDDGYADAYSVVTPLLKQYGFVGTFFVTVNLIGRPGYMTREQVSELSDAGMDVQSHAMDHVSMADLSGAQQRYQMCTARTYLNTWTGTNVRYFAYPSGDYNGESFGALAACGYLAAYKKAGGSLQSQGAMFLLQRSRVRGQQGVGALLLALQG
ncbi:MAG: polysaccharide deacetylase family protein [Chloroflexota bacterium]|nr:polysaccharide deacetylase family protein [Chloroflexota bacterium]